MPYTDKEIAEFNLVLDAKLNIFQQFEHGRRPRSQKGWHFVDVIKGTEKPFTKNEKAYAYYREQQLTLKVDTCLVEPSEGSSSELIGSSLPAELKQQRPVEHGTRCCKCDKTIPDGRLIALPGINSCVDCSETASRPTRSVWVTPRRKRACPRCGSSMMVRRNPQNETCLLRCGSYPGCRYEE